MSYNFRLTKYLIDYGSFNIRWINESRNVCCTYNFGSYLFHCDVFLLFFCTAAMCIPEIRLQKFSNVANNIEWIVIAKSKTATRKLKLRFNKLSNHLRQVQLRNVSIRIEVVQVLTMYPFTFSIACNASLISLLIVSVSFPEIKTIKLNRKQS